MKSSVNVCTFESRAGLMDFVPHDGRLFRVIPATGPAEGSPCALHWSME